MPTMGFVITHHLEEAEAYLYDHGQDGMAGIDGDSHMDLGFPFLFSF